MAKIIEDKVKRRKRCIAPTICPFVKIIVYFS
jgi:hypothetical protein